MPQVNRSSYLSLGSEKSFHFESSRWRSFSSYPWPYHTSPSHLAKSGFYYSQSENVVKCHFCSLVTSVHEIGRRSVKDFHHDCSPLCPVVTNTDDANIPMPKFFDFGSQETTPITCTQETSCHNDIDIIASRIGVNLRPLNHQNATGTRRFSTGLYPKYAFDLMRRKSFCISNTYSHLHADLIQKLVQSGFFAVGEGDSTLCYCCGLHLYGWTSIDEPDIAHARWSPSCRFLAERLSSSFVSLIQTEIRVIGS